MFFHDINICQRPLTMLYYTPGVRHLSLIAAQAEGEREYMCGHVNVYVSPYICLKERGEGFMDVLLLPPCSCYKTLTVILLRVCACAFFPNQNSFSSFLHKGSVFSTQTTSGCWTKCGIRSSILRDVYNEMIPNAQYQGGAAILRWKALHSAHRGFKQGEGSL